jgi:hypothetical protein
MATGSGIRSREWQHRSNVPRSHAAPIRHRTALGLLGEGRAMMRSPHVSKRLRDGESRGAALK